MRLTSSFPLLQFLISVFLLTSLAGISPLPDWVTPSILRAEMAYENGSYYDAYFDYRKLWELMPYRADIAEKLAETAIKINNFNEGKQLLEQLADEETLSAKGLLILADIYQQEGNLSKVISTYQKVPDGSVESSIAEANLLKIYISNSDWSNAKKLLDDEPKNLFKLAAVNLFIDPGLVIKEASLPEVLSLRLLAEDLTQEQNNCVSLASTWIRIGQVFAQNSENDLAQAAFREAIKLTPESGVPWAALGGLLAGLGNGGEAEIQQSLNLDSNSFVVNQTAGYVYLKNNKPDVALVYLLKANKMVPDDVETLLLLSQAELILGQYPQALSHWAEAAPLADKPSDVWRDLINFTLENTLFLRENGLPAVRKLLQEAGVSAEDYDLAARVYLALEDPLTAEKYWRYAISHYPMSYISHLHLGIWLAENGFEAEGRNLIKQAAEQDADQEISQKARQWLSSR